MADIELDISGEAALRNAFRTLEPRVRKRVLKAANRAGANVIAKQARKNAPKRKTDGFLEEAKFDFEGTVRFPGNLKKSIRAQNLKESNPNAEVAHGVGFKDATSRAYGTAIEKGNSHQSAQPYIRPAFDAKADEAGQMIEDRAWEGIKREWAKNA